MIGCLVFKSAVNFQTVFSQAFAELNLAICVLEHYNTPHISDAGWSSLVARRAHTSSVKRTPILGFFYTINLLFKYQRVVFNTLIIIEKLGCKPFFYVYRLGRLFWQLWNKNYRIYYKAR